MKAEVVVFGGIKDRAVDNFVRIRPNDQEVVTPTTEGFISVPTFDFGQVGVAGSKQQHSLKKPRITTATAHAIRMSELRKLNQIGA